MYLSFIFKSTFFICRIYFCNRHQIVSGKKCVRIRNNILIYPLESKGYNYPLKGYKGTLYEGGTKVN